MIPATAHAALCGFCRRPIRGRLLQRRIYCSVTCRNRAHDVTRGKSWKP